jgi:acyl-CoA synthetase (AMP-forming)/AMP-acid ligase II
VSWSWYRTLRQTGVLTPSPVWALWLLVRSVVQHGLTLYALVAWWAARFPDQPALHDGTVSLTFRTLLQATQACAAELMALGVGRTVQKVGLLAHNHVHMVIALLACPRVSGNLLVLNTALSADELAELCRREGVELLLCDQDSLARSPDLVRLAGVRVELLPDVCAAAHPPHLPRPTRPGQMFLLTSGTTGQPKVLRRDQPWRAVPGVMALLSSLDVRRGERVELTLPLFHGHGLATLALCVALGAPLTLRPRFDSRETWARLIDGETQVLVVVPTVLYRLLQVVPTVSPQPQALRAIICGSAPLGETLANGALSRFGPVLYNLYGTSELGILTVAMPHDLLAAPDSVGYALPGIDLQVRTTQNPPADDDHMGELWVRGGLAGPRWVNTGDLGTVNGGGLLSLQGRQDDLLICGGENVVPDVLERRIATLAPVEECAVRGCPDEEYGQAVDLFVVLSPGATAEQVSAALQTLPRRLRPKSITVVESLSRTVLGKVQRHALPQGGP